MTSMRNQIRYAGFYRKLLNSPSREVRGLARIISSDPRSTTCRNIRLLRDKTGMGQPHVYSSAKVKAALPVESVPESEKWRLGLLTSLMKLRSEKYLRVEDSKSIYAMNESLCSTWGPAAQSLLLLWVTPHYLGALLGAASMWRKFLIFYTWNSLCSNKS